MSSRAFAFWGGIVMLVMGALSMIPALSAHPPWLPPLRFDVSYGLFLNIFPLNILNKLALLGFGLAGVITSNSITGSIRYSRIVFLVMGALAILGLFPATNTLFGLMPLYGPEVLTHAIFALLGAYAGYASAARLGTPRSPA
ncbi:MAG TPA: DUF4383 domain-containing protein [Bdellovibrionales bacterium]|nr:DUF4383 domain-containing protein [Bdellovibrionales bacterium]